LRLEAIVPRRSSLLDGAHIPREPERSLASSREHLRGRKLRLIYGSMKDKAVRDDHGPALALAD